MVPKKAALLCLQHRHQLLTAAALCSKFAITGTLMCVALLLSPHLLARATAQTIPSITQILQDLDIVEDSCTELHKECHCGSIAQGPDSALFTRIVFPNTTTVIEEYDENVPYGYKHLRVYYRCADEENVLVGNNMRECSNGNWKGLVPRCGRCFLQCHQLHHFNHFRRCVLVQSIFLSQ